MRNPLGRKIRVTFVWPAGFLPAYALPMAFGYLKANVDADLCDFTLIDCVLDKLDARHPEFLRRLAESKPDIVGVSSWSPMFPEALAVLQAAKKMCPDITTIIGGAHATSYYHKVLQFPEIDFVFRGESDLAFQPFLEQWAQPVPDWSVVRGLTYLQEGKLVEYDMEREAEMDRIKSPDYEFFHLQRYQKEGYRWNSPAAPNAPLWITRGCPYRCQYCAAPQLNGKSVRKHSVAYMVAQIQDLYAKGSRWFNIIDDNFTFDVKYAKEFCKAMIELNLPGVGFGTPNGIRMSRGDTELWKLMKQAGWRHLIVAPESGSSHTLQLMKKDLKLDTVPQIVREIRSAGLKVQAFFIIGYPGETPQDLEETAALIRRCKFNFVFLANFQPLPGTPVYDQLVREGKISDWLLPHNFSDAKRTYTSPEFEGFNFSRFILRMHAMMMLNDPTNIPYHLGVAFRLFKPTVVLKKLLMNVFSMLKPERGHPAAPIFKPMHEQTSAALVP